MDKEKYCILENDGVALCVCKHRPCKQLKRLQAENERLKAKKEELIDQNFKIAQKYTKLEQENERLKFQLDNAPLGVLDTYKKALQEIRDIADIIYNCNCNWVSESGKILKIIDEVIGAE